MANTPSPPSSPPAESLSSARASHGTRPPLAVGERILSVSRYFLTVYRRTWRGSIINRFLSPVFFLLSMGVGLGTLVDRRAGGIDGTPYLHFVVPAIVATQAMWVAMGESTYQVLGYIKWNMGYHAMLATPLTVRDVLMGHLLTVAGHMTVASSIFMAVAALFGGFGSWWALLCLPVAILTGMAFAVPIFAFTARQQGDDGFNILFRWVMTPLMLFSGTFFPITQLPLWMQPVAWGTPLWHGVEASRMAASGAVTWPEFTAHTLALWAFIAVGWVLAVGSFRQRLVP